MANNLTGNPWTIDTPSAAPIFGTPVMVQQFEWGGYALDTDTVVITDLAGRLIYQFNGAADLSTQRSGTIGQTQGLVIATLTSGKILVFIK